VTGGTKVLGIKSVPVPLFSTKIPELFTHKLEADFCSKKRATDGLNYAVVLLYTSEIRVPNKF
jgi:hypothetical protein